MIVVDVAELPLAQRVAGENPDEGKEGGDYQTPQWNRHGEPSMLL
jgi:hypothetical protein